MTPNALLYGGTTVSCTLRDGSTVSVKLRLIKISEIPAYLDVSLDDAKALVFCVESPTPFDPDALTDDSFLALAAANTELNFSRALAMSDQRLKRAESNGVGLAQLAVNLASVLNRYSPKSPSPEATPASNSST
jgi:hypothetical protein